MLKRLILILILIRILLFPSSAQACTGKWLNGTGNNLFDLHAKEVRLTGINWIGFETSNILPHFQWPFGIKSILKQKKDQGFKNLCIDIFVPGASFNSSNLNSIFLYTGVSPFYKVEPTINMPNEIFSLLNYCCQESNVKIICENYSPHNKFYLSLLERYSFIASESKFIIEQVFSANSNKNHNALTSINSDNKPNESNYSFSDDKEAIFFYPFILKEIYV